MWKQWQKIPKELTKDMGGSIIGKWHFHYENEHGDIISVIKLNYNFNFFMRRQNYSWEACGHLDNRRFQSLKDAEKEIYKALSKKRKNEKES